MPSILVNVKDAKIGVRRTTIGRDYFDGSRRVGQGRGHIVKVVTRGDRSHGRQPIISSGFAGQRLQTPGPKAAAQAIRKAADINWKPAHTHNTVGGGVEKPAG